MSGQSLAELNSVLSWQMLARTFTFINYIKSRQCELGASNSAMMVHMFGCTLIPTALESTGQSLAVFQQFVFVTNDCEYVIIESFYKTRPVTGLI